MLLQSEEPMRAKTAKKDRNDSHVSPLPLHPSQVERNLADFLSSHFVSVMKFLSPPPYSYMICIELENIIRNISEKIPVVLAPFSNQHDRPALSPALHGSREINNNHS